MAERMPGDLDASDRIVLPAAFALVLGCQAAADLYLRRDRDRVLLGVPAGQALVRDDGGAPAPGGPAAGAPAWCGLARVPGQLRAGQEAFFVSSGRGLTLIRPARKDETAPEYFPNWLRQRVEAIIWILKDQLGPERHGGRVPAGRWAPRRPAAARAERRDLVQLADRAPCQALPHQLRPLSCPHFPVNDLVVLC
jgi:hypothetical protein